MPGTGSGNQICGTIIYFKMMGRQYMVRFILRARNQQAFDGLCPMVLGGEWLNIHQRWGVFAGRIHEGMWVLDSEHSISIDDIQNLDVDARNMIVSHNSCAVGRVSDEMWVRMSQEFGGDVTMTVAVFDREGGADSVEIFNCRDGQISAVLEVPVAEALPAIFGDRLGSMLLLENTRLKATHSHVAELI